MSNQEIIEEKGTHSIYKTTDGAENWNKISPQLTDWNGGRLGTITTICAAPTNPEVIYAGSDDAHVWVTTNGGNNWIDISAGLPQRWVTRVVVDPSDENIVYVTFNGLRWRDPQPHVFRSTNKGADWSDISSNLPDAPVNAFAVDNNYANILYIGNDVGMYVSFNTGQSWEVLGEGLPVLPVGDIKIHPSENFLVAGTHGRSMYRIDLNKVTSAENEQPQVVNNFSLEQNYPNPFNPVTKIKYSIPTSPQSQKVGTGLALSDVTLKVYDILGNEIATIVNEQQAAGSYEVEFSANKLASGVYIYRLHAGNKSSGSANSFTASKKFVVLK